MKFGNTRHITVVPVISATPDYTAGDAIGGIQTIGPMGSHNGSGILKTLLIVDNANQKPALTILLFKGVPTGTWVDNGAASPSAIDIANAIGKINILTTDWETIDSKAYVCPNLAQIIKSAPGTDDAGNANDKLYFYVGVIVTGGGLNFAAITDLTFQYGMLLD